MGDKNEAAKRIKAHADSLAGVPHNAQFRADLYALCEQATPPADAALVDATAELHHDGSPVLTLHGLASHIDAMIPDAESYDKTYLTQAAAALRARAVPDRDSIDYARGFSDGVMFRAVPEGKKYHDVAQRLYSILDDIDTAGDIAKSDDKLYRGIVERTQAKKRDYVVSCDGYVVTLADDSMLAASKAGEGKV